MVAYNLTHAIKLAVLQAPLGCKIMGLRRTRTVCQGGQDARRYLVVLVDKPMVSS